MGNFTYLPTPVWKKSIVFRMRAAPIGVRAIWIFLKPMVRV